MKYLHVISSVDPVLGGPVEGVIQLSRWMTKCGHTVHVASCDDPEAEHVRRSSLEVIPLGPGRGRYGYSARLVPWLREHHHEYAVVVVNGLWQYHSYACWRALRRTPTPYVVFTHGMLDPYFKRAYPLKHLKKWLYWPWAEYRVLANAQAVLFTSEEERRLARQSFWLYRARERVVAYGTATPPEDDPQGQLRAFRERFPELTGKRLLLFLGRIHPKKGCDLAIEAFAAVAHRDERLQLVMAGPDQVGWRSELEALARRLGVAARVTWTGMLEKDLKWGAFRASELFVLPSHQENFGIVVAEAMALAKPVLITDKVNIWREIEQDRAGLVGTDDLAGTRRCFEGWLALPPAARAAMADQATQCFGRRFEIARVAGSLFQVLCDSIEQRQAALAGRGVVAPEPAT